MRVRMRLRCSCSSVSPPPPLPPRPPEVPPLRPRSLYASRLDNFIVRQALAGTGALCLWLSSPTGPCNYLEKSQHLFRTKKGARSFPSGDICCALQWGQG